MVKVKVKVKVMVKVKVNFKVKVIEVFLKIWTRSNKQGPHYKFFS